MPTPAATAALVEMLAACAALQALAGGSMDAAAVKARIVEGDGNPSTADTATAWDGTALSLTSGSGPSAGSVMWINIRNGDDTSTEQGVGFWRYETSWQVGIVLPWSNANDLQASYRDARTALHAIAGQVRAQSCTAGKLICNQVNPIGPHRPEEDSAIKRAHLGLIEITASNVR